MTPPKQIPISRFKAELLQLAKDLARSGETIEVTHYGRPCLEVRPLGSPPSLVGSVKQLVSDDELVKPTSAEWNADS